MNQNYKSLRVFAEGVRIPTSSVTRTQKTGTPVNFTLSIPATPVGVAVLPGTYITVFVRRENPEGGIEYSLFAEGRLKSRKIKVNNNSGKQISLRCESLDGQWDDIPLGLNVGHGYGNHRPKLMNFFNGLSPREPAEGSGYEYYFEQAADSKMRTAPSAGGQGKTDSYVSVEKKIQQAMREKGIVVGLAEVVAALYKYGPIFRRDYNSLKFYKRFGLINNQKVTDFITRDFNLDQIGQNINEMKDGASLQDVLNRFLKISMHEYISIGSPYFNKKKQEDQEKKEEAQKEENSCPEAPWMDKEGNARIEGALHDPRVKGFLDTVAHYEIGEPDANGTDLQKRRGYLTGAGGRVYPAEVSTKPNKDERPDLGTKPGSKKRRTYSDNRDHPWVGKSKNRPEFVTYDDGSREVFYPDQGDDVPEEGDDGVESTSTTTAVGRYQMIASTWEAQKAKSDRINDFGPESQDRAATYLLDQVGALEPLGNCDLVGALGGGGEGRGAADQWASLPDATGEGGFVDDDSSGNQEAGDSLSGVFDTYKQNVKKYDEQAAKEIDRQETIDTAPDLETGIMQSMVFKPNTHFEPPPVSNILFGGEITNASISDDFDRAPTRTMTMATPEALSSQAIGNMQNAWKFPLHFAPRHLSGLISALRTNNKSDLKMPDGFNDDLDGWEEQFVKIKEKQGEDFNPDAYMPDQTAPVYNRHATEYELYKRILQGEVGGAKDDLLQMYTYEELFRGVRPSVRRFPFYEKGEEDKDAAAMYSQHQFGVITNSGRNATVTTKLNLDVVPGFPVAIYDESTGWIVGEPFQVRDQIRANGSSSTTIQLYNCRFLADQLNPHYERIQRENESEFAKIDKDGAVQNPIFFDKEFDADSIGDTVYDGLLGEESIIDLAKRLTGEEEMSVRDALDVMRRTYDRNGGQNWLQKVRFRSIATEGQVMQKVLDAYPPEELVQEEDSDIPIRDQIYERYRETYSARVVPSSETGEKEGTTPCFVEERQGWADMYVKDLRERGFSFSENKSGTTGTRVQDWEEEREEVLQQWQSDLKLFKEQFSSHQEPNEGSNGVAPENTFNDPLFRLGLDPDDAEGSE